MSDPLPYYNPLTPEFRRDPYPHYKEMRERDPVHWSYSGHCWVLTRHDHIKLVLSDKRFGIGLDRLMQIEALKPTFAERFNKIIRTQILAADPPDHPRIRAIVTKAFSVQQMERLRGHIQESVDKLIDAKVAERKMDFIKDLAYPLPFNVICDLLSLPLSAEREPLSHWTHALMRSTDPTPMTRDDLDNANEGAGNFRAYFLDLARERRANPTDDVFTEMVRAVDAGTINEEEFVANMILIFCAGHDTVVNLFGNGLLALARHPDQIALLRAQPDLMKNAIEELLRYDASVQIARRIPFEHVAVGGHLLQEGAYILCLLGAANRDPEVYPDPDRLDVTRKNIRPMSFGGGIHYCLGAQLARVEGELVFGTLLKRMPELTVDVDKAEWNRNTFIRGLSTLPISW